LCFSGKTVYYLLMTRSWFDKIFRSKPGPDSQNLQASAATGNAEAQFHLGLHYASGEGPTQDYTQAVQWYLKAADQHHALAQFNLGIMYSLGQGVPPDQAEAGRWFGQAAQLGDAGAQYNLGLNHYRASLHGLEQDAPESRIEAYKWFALAAAQGYLGADDVRPAMVGHMSRADMTEANHRVTTATQNSLPTAS
jgi:TPR repeat protein